jgi:hypothetical protein
MIAGILLQEYPENFPFEFSSRLLNSYGITSNITNLIKQFDEQSIRHCALIVPYYQLQPPGSGLVHSMNKHTGSVVDFDFTDDQMTAITLSDRIIVINMHEANTVLDIKLPKLDEPYLNCTTLPKIYHFVGNNEISDGDSNSENNQFKRFLFLVNSFHHVYLVSAHEDIKFERSSEVGYATVEILHIKRGLCVLAEINSNCVECWDVVRNRLFSRIEFPSSPIKIVLCVNIYSMIITVLQDGSIHFHSISDWTQSLFIHRGTIQAGTHLDLVVVDGRKLVCTFDSTIPIDFAFIDLQTLHESQRVSSDNELLKTLIAFDPPLESKPIKRIVLPNKETLTIDNDTAYSPLFMAMTNSSLYVIHKCANNNISYIRIDGHYDVVCMHAKNPEAVYTARGGIIELYKWACVKIGNDKDDNLKCVHKHKLYVSIDIGSSPVTAIRPSAEMGKFSFMMKYVIQLFILHQHSGPIFMLDAEWINTSVPCYTGARRFQEYTTFSTYK